MKIKKDKIAKNAKKIISKKNEIEKEKVKKNEIDKQLKSSVKKTKNVDKSIKSTTDICKILEKCSIDEISKYLIMKGSKKSFPDITARQ